MAVLIKYTIVFVLTLYLILCAVYLFGRSKGHNELMNEQHTEIYKEVCETKAKVIENGRKLDILLNIATNSVNGDFR